MLSVMPPCPRNKHSGTIVLLIRDASGQSARSWGSILSFIVYLGLKGLRDHVHSGLGARRGSSTRLCAYTLHQQTRYDVSNKPIVPSWSAALDDMSHWTMKIANGQRIS